MPNSAKFQKFEIILFSKDNDLHTGISLSFTPRVIYILTKLFHVIQGSGEEECLFSIILLFAKLQIFEHLIWNVPKPTLAFWKEARNSDSP